MVKFYVSIELTCNKRTTVPEILTSNACYDRIKKQ